MPFYEFQCLKCDSKYTEMTSWDETGKWAKVKCPECGSKKKEKLISVCSFKFAQPEGTDRWNSDSTGHDYRYKYNAPKIREERAMAEALSHMGSDPYTDTSAADIEMDTGIHDAEFRPGLS
jgi:putative FmdB family regulatory protein